MKSEAPNNCTMKATRTPEQASIEARPAREAWERGELIEFNYGLQGWLPWNPQNVLHPYFTSVEHRWRAAKPKSAPVITPGRWRMRNGEVVEVKRLDHPILDEFPFQLSNGSACRIDGTVAFKLGNQHDHDLLARVETRWRAWRPEEVPLGREVRSKHNHTHRYLITTVLDQVSTNELFNDSELLNPDGTYSPCGVEEVVG